MHPLLLLLQHFHLGANYLEVDLDVHNYAFIARKALWSYHDRLATVVWDMGCVIQVRGRERYCLPSVCYGFQPGFALGIGGIGSDGW